MLVFTNSLGGFVVNEVRYNLEGAQYQRSGNYIIIIIIIIIIINKYILAFIYLMPWKFVCDLKFHEVLQRTIIRQLKKENEEIEKIEK